MIVDNILGKERQHEPSRKPVLKKYDIHYSNLDPELRKLRYVMIAPTADNREYCFWNDSVSQSFGIMTASLITGDGLRIRCNNGNAKALINDFNEEINVKGHSIDDYYTHTWLDELVHGFDTWRIDYNKDYSTKTDIQRLDPKTLTYVDDPTRGWDMYIQKVPNYKQYRSETSFYRNAGKNDDLGIQFRYNTREIRIPIKPDVVIKNSFFLRPPVASATHYMVYKRFILYFMRKYSQNLWTPKLLFMVGNPMSTQYPVDDEDMQQAIDDVAEIIPELTTFSAAAMPGNIMPIEIGKNSIRGSLAFIEYINLLNKEIMMAQFASMGLRDASGNELATSRTLKEIYLQFIQGIRKKYSHSLEIFYRKALCKINGIHLSPGDINIEHSPLKFEPTQEYMSGIDLALKAGVFKDRNEVRKAAQTIWSWIEELPKGQNTKIKFIHPLEQKMNTPAFGQKTTPTGQKPKPKPKTVSNEKYEAFNNFFQSQL